MSLQDTQREQANREWNPRFPVGSRKLFNFFRWLPTLGCDVGGGLCQLSGSAQGKKYRLRVLFPQGSFHSSKEFHSLSCSLCLPTCICARTWPPPSIYINSQAGKFWLAFHVVKKKRCKWFSASEDFWKWNYVCPEAFFILGSCRFGDSAD